MRSLAHTRPLATRRWYDFDQHCEFKCAARTQGEALSIPLGETWRLCPKLARRPASAPLATGVEFHRHASQAVLPGPRSYPKL